MRIDINLKSYDIEGRWPKIRLYNNKTLIADVTCNQTDINLHYDIEPLQKNVFVIEFYNKSFGDNGIWDVSTNSEMRLELIDLQFDGVSIGHLKNNLPFFTSWTPHQIQNESYEFLEKYSLLDYSNGIMVFNGELVFEYTTPIYDFLILKKFKVDYNKNLTYFSNYTETFHYDTALEIIKEIEEIIKSNG